MALHVYFRTEEREAIRSAADAFGVSQSAIVRYAVRVYFGLAVPRRFATMPTADELPLVDERDE